MHKLSPTLYKTGFGHQACQTFSSIRELFLHRHPVGTSHVVEVEVISGTSEITKIQQDTLASEVRVYDIIAVSQYQESYPFKVYTIASLMRYINAGQIASFSYSVCKIRHSYTHLSDVERVLLIGKCRTVAHKMLRHALQDKSITFTT